MIEIIEDQISRITGFHCKVHKFYRNNLDEEPECTMWIDECHVDPAHEKQVAKIAEEWRQILRRNDVR